MSKNEPVILIDTERYKTAKIVKNDKTKICDHCRRTIRKGSRYIKDNAKNKIEYHYCLKCTGLI